MPHKAINGRANTAPAVPLGLHNAVKKLAPITSPSVAQILGHHEDEFESETLAEVVDAFEEVQLPNDLAINTESPDCQQFSRATPTTHPFALYYEAMNADNAWQDELERLFGKRAGDARYDKRGTSTPTLALLHDEFRRKLDIWLEAMNNRN